MKDSKSYLPRKFLSLALSFALAATWMIPSSLAVYADEGDGSVAAGEPAAFAYDSGSGTEEDPGVITSAATLEAFAAEVDGGNHLNDFVELGADIDISGIENWNPIGAESGRNNVFGGDFDGAGYAISGMTIATYDASWMNCGLFSTLGGTAKVHDLGVEDAVISADVPEAAMYARAGLVSGWILGGSASVSDVTTSGEITLNSNGTSVYAGGIIGNMLSGASIVNGVSDVDITVDEAGSAYGNGVGGLAGSAGNKSVVANCAVLGDTSFASKTAVGTIGGAAGIASGVVTGSYVSGAVTYSGAETNFAGALIGELANGTGTVKADALYYASDATELDAVGTVDAEGMTVGAQAAEAASMTGDDFAGIMNGTLKNTYATLGDTFALNKWVFDGNVVPAGEEYEYVVAEMTSASVGGVTYYYADTEGNSEDTVYQVSVYNRRTQTTTTYDFALSELTQVAGTTYYYTTLDGVTPLSGTLYGYVPGSGEVKSYKDVYSELNASADESYDAVTSATHFTSHHAGDIPSVVAFGTDDEGNKVITGVKTGREKKTVDAEAYVDASILKAAGEELTEEQSSALDIELKADPMNAPEDNVAAKVGSMEYVKSKYGVGTINIYPDESVDGYVWNEYLDNIYAATVSDGTKTVGAVHWIDIYGESASTPGHHYNKIELEINNGKVPESNSNGATVDRFADFVDAETGFLKPGTYTVSVYAEGYDVIKGEITISAEEMQQANIGGVNYYYADTKDDANVIYQAVVRSRMSSKKYGFLKSDLKQQIDGTDYCYTTVPGVDTLEGTLYGYVPGTGTVKSYKDIYSELGVETDDSYDAVTSATHFTSHHAGDIPSVVNFGKDAEGNKVIDGVRFGRESATVDAKAYVDASVLKAAKAELTEDQTAALNIDLKANPMSAPKENVAAKVGSVEMATSKYGAEEFNIYPDESVDGYVWNEYLDNLYAATISDGKTTVGAVHWIDLYGESAATPGHHYNKVEFELNNGKVPESNDNGATVNRYAAFFGDDNKVKDGTYTIKLYAEGYDTVEAKIDYVSEKSQATTAAEASKKAASKVTSAKYTAASYKAVQAAKKALDKAIASGDAAKIKEATEALDKAVSAAKTKSGATVKKVSPLKKTFKAKKLKKKALKFKMKATVSSKAKASFKKVSGNKKITVAKTGKVTVNKGLKKGSYKVKVKVTAPATANAKAAAKTVTLVVKVK